MVTTRLAGEGWTRCWGGRAIPRKGFQDGGMNDDLMARLMAIERKLNRLEINKARLVRAIIISSEVDTKVMSACVSVAARRFDDFDAALNEITKLNGQMLEILDEVLTSERDPASQ